MSFEEAHRIADAYRDMERAEATFRPRALAFEVFINGTCVALLAPYLYEFFDVPSSIKVSLGALGFVLTFMQVVKFCFWLEAKRRSL